MAAAISTGAYDDFQKVSKKQDTAGKTGTGTKLVYAIFAIKDDKEVVTEKVATGKVFSNTESAAELANFKDALFNQFRGDMAKYNQKGSITDGVNAKGEKSPCPRYAVLDVHLMSKDGTAPTSKLILIRFSPDEAQVGKKMQYAQTEGAFKARLGIAKVWQVTDYATFTYDECVAYARTA
jgi:hypothetical protein